MLLRRLPVSLALIVALGACAAESPSASAGAPVPAGTAAAAAGAAAAAPAVAPGGLPAQADRAAISAGLDKVLPGIPVESVSASPIPGLAEVAVQGRVFYMTNDGRYLLIQGAMIDVQANTNLTRLSEGALRKGALDAVGPERRIIFAAAQPKHRITVFTDIDCGYCRRMHQQIDEYNRLGITVEYLFYPRAGLNSEPYEQAVAVWCSQNRKGALTAAKNGLVLPHADCANPVRDDMELARRVGVDGTPAIYAENGVQLGGYLEPAEMLSRLEEMATAPR